MELLSHEQTLELIALAKKGDEEAKETLIVRNEALVKSIVRGFLQRGVEYDDLMQIGTMGLLKAIYGYDPNYGVRFSTYAVPMIAGDIKRFLRDDGIIKVSRSLKENASKICRVKEMLKKQQGEEPSVEEISRVVGISPEEIVFAMEAMCTPVSIYEPVYDDGENKTQIIDTVQCADNNGEVIDKIFLKQLISTLNARERKLIMLRFFSDKTQSQIAEIMGVSQVQVSRQLTKTLSKLRKAAK
jgi:RNA polymerase sporulation-specific sigma factor